MLMSNKKLMQKRRAELLAKRVAETDPNKKNPDSNSETQSLKSLLDSVTQEPRFPKIEKRRKFVFFSKGSNQETQEKGVEIEVEEEKSEEAEKKKKKRKRVEDVATKVYVGGIPYRYTEDDIRYYFEDCGTIVDVDCMKFPDTGKFRGIAIISFKMEAAAKEALALDRTEMGGMQLTIQPYKSTRANKATGFAPEMVEGYNIIYVGNLSWHITEDDLKKLFSDCNVSSIRFGLDKETGEFRGYAHVDFADSVSVAMALKLDQEIVCGRPVKISCAVPKKGVKTESRSRSTRKEIPTRNEAPSSKKIPTTNEAPPSKEAPASNEAHMDNEAENDGASISSGKLRRRTCYECGQKGHLSSACPNNEVPTRNKASENDGASISCGKSRRRTCYECGQKGHLSSACPNNEVPTRNKAPPGKEIPTTNEAPVGTEAENSGSSVRSGKLRRRTCYECGQKGHISSACPNKKTAETANTNTN